MAYKISFSWNNNEKKGVNEVQHKDLCYYLEQRLNATVNNDKCKAEMITESPEEVGATFLELEDILTEKITYKICPIKLKRIRGY